mmetsp:Transcript_27731/g.42447  ORF Transcript_27731/g.42447 Transcript_27731/m.42447 type:complete len:1162 (-) Transcript_27731:1988-5473(-)|eukprot:CAMPEP_0195306798 /NCGR_PEP_ID=MMETSP0707-20130614/37381_1 /TAXON_ID=33640 /ORGANISM="Asterionellopsis glacialis, Strain CCMP134" /LENGTH=1161 /DNA_ID=CAMNT_0040371025 /DNA_START=189 /DNA_END=3674 /DNA_ORIENTATION=+
MNRRCSNSSLDSSYGSTIAKEYSVYMRVTGMMCQKNCGTTVTNALMDLPGIISAECSFAMSSATVTASLDAYASPPSTPTHSDIPIEHDNSNNHNGDDDTRTIALIQKFQDEAIDAVECVGFDAELITKDEWDIQFEQQQQQQLEATTKNQATIEQQQRALNLLQQQEAQEDASLAQSGTYGASFQIGGMSCAVCTGRVERALMAVHGVSRATVTLAVNRARAQFEPSSDMAPDKLAQACVESVVEGGYDCELLQLITPGASEIDGISLAENAQRLENARVQELQTWRQLLLWSLVLTVPIAILHYTSMSSSYGSHHPYDHDNTPPPRLPTPQEYIMLALTTPVQFGVGKRYYVAAYKSWRNGRVLGMDFLVVMGTSASYLYSITVFLLQLSGVTSTTLHPTFETSAMLITFVTLGKFLEAFAKGKTATALQKLMELQPSTASRILVPPSPVVVSSDKEQQQEEDDYLQDISSLETEEIHAADAQVGDCLLVLPGARIPADGILVATSDKEAGRSYVDESAFSGEPFPVSKQAGDVVFGSTVNQLSALVIRVTATGGGTALAKIVRLIEEAQSSRAPIQAQADAIACVFAPFVLCLSALTFCGWMIFDQEADLEQRFFLALTSGISVIVVACPCALGLATPTAVMVGTGVGATHGLLIKGGAVLEGAHGVDTVILDKTGTITTGRAVLGDVVEFLDTSKETTKGNHDQQHHHHHHQQQQLPTNPLLQNLPKGIPKNRVALWLAACAEKQSEHPLAKAIVTAAQGLWGRDFTCLQQGVHVSEFQVIPGSGVESLIHEESWGKWRVRVGTKTFVNGPPGILSDKTSEKSHKGELMHPSLEINCVGDSEVMALRQRGQVGIYVSVIAEQHCIQKQDALGNDYSRQVIGVIGIVDPVVDEARSTVLALKRIGVDVWMCTGDHDVTARAVARQVGIDQENVCAGVKPEGKADLVTRLQKKERPQARLSKFRRQTDKDDQRRQHQDGLVAVVGDGINDSIALARADVGIAIGAGTEVAVEAADVVLVRSSLHDVVVALHLSRTVFHRIRWNFVWALGYNLFALPFAAGAMYPFLNWRLPPEFAGLMMAFSSVSVVTSSLLLRMYSKPAIQEDGTLQASGCCFSFCQSELKQRRPPGFCDEMARELLGGDKYDDLTQQDEESVNFELV